MATHFRVVVLMAHNEQVLVSGCLHTEAKGQLAQARCSKQCD